jgi:hypothetical protein
MTLAHRSLPDQMQEDDDVSTSSNRGGGSGEIANCEAAWPKPPHHYALN